MAFKVKTMLDLIGTAAPLLFSSFGQIREVVGTPRESSVARESYARMKAINFSRGVLEAIPPDHPSPLLVLPVRGVFWSDWGSEERISNIIRRRVFDDDTLRQFGRSVRAQRMASQSTKWSVDTTKWSKVERLPDYQSRQK